MRFFLQMIKEWTGWSDEVLLVLFHFLLLLLFMLAIFMSPGAQGR